MFSYIPGIYPLPQAVTTQNVSRHCPPGAGEQGGDRRIESRTPGHEHFELLESLLCLEWSPRVCSKGQTYSCLVTDRGIWELLKCLIGTWGNKEQLKLRDHDSGNSKVRISGL